MQVIRRSSFTAIPWKNGGGITHEAFRVPRSGDPFRWRVSVAQIETSGPFSDFTGYSRKMILLRGGGVRLRFDGANDRYLHDIGDLAEFDGAAKTECDLLAGPCTDLNLMVSTSMIGVRVWVERLHELRSLHAPVGRTTLIFGILGALSVNSPAGETTRLDPWDLAVLAPGDAAILVPVALEQAAAPLVFFAALDDNSPHSC